MNLLFIGIIIFILVFLLLSWFAKSSSKKVAAFIRRSIFILSIVIAIALLIGGRILFSLPLLFLALSIFKIKGLTAIQIFQLWRLLQFLRRSGRFSYYGQHHQTQPSTNISLDDAYNILGLKKGCSKDEVISKYKKIMQKLHPDSNKDINTTKLAQIVSEAKETIIKYDFS